MILPKVLCWEAVVAVEVFEHVIFLAPAIAKPDFKRLGVLNGNSIDMEATPMHVNRLWWTAFEERRAECENVLTELAGRNSLVRNRAIIKPFCCILELVETKLQARASWK